MITPTLPLLLEPDDLQPLLDRKDLLIIDVCQPSLYQQLHIPGAVHVSPAELVSGTPPAPGKLPDLARLKALFSRVGLGADKHVIAYDDEGGGWAGRLLWTLDVLGHHHYSYLNGGIHAWKNEGHPVTNEIPRITASDFNPVIDNSLVIDAETLKAGLAEKKIIVWDARTAEEFNGSKKTALRNGHMPGAVHLDWLDTMDRANNYRLLPLTELREKLQKLGITQDTHVVTHCHTHHRSGLTYLIGKLLQLNIRAYDGSWSEWGNRIDTPVV